VPKYLFAHYKWIAIVATAIWLAYAVFGSGVRIEILAKNVSVVRGTTTTQVKTWGDPLFKAGVNWILVKQAYAGVIAVMTCHLVLVAAKRKKSIDE
jgi:hypothetical protein